jgi:hypothetical protein
MEIWLGAEGTVRMLSRLDRVCDEERPPRLPPLTSQLLLSLEHQMPRPLPLQENARIPIGRRLLLSNQNPDDSLKTITSLSQSHRPHHSLASLSTTPGDHLNPDKTQMPLASPSAAWTFVIKPKLHHLKEQMMSLFKRKPHSSHNAKFAQAPDTHHAKPKIPKSKASRSHQSLKDMKFVPVPAPKS